MICRILTITEARALRENLTEGKVSWRDLRSKQAKLFVRERLKFGTIFELSRSLSCFDYECE